MLGKKFVVLLVMALNMLVPIYNAFSDPGAVSGPTGQQNVSQSSSPPSGDPIGYEDPNGSSTLGDEGSSSDDYYGATKPNSGTKPHLGEDPTDTGGGSGDGGSSGTGSGSAEDNGSGEGGSSGNSNSAPVIAGVYVDSYGNLWGKTVEGGDDIPIDTSSQPNLDGDPSPNGGPSEQYLRTESNHGYDLWWYKEIYLVTYSDGTKKLHYVGNNYLTGEHYDYYVEVGGGPTPVPSGTSNPTPPESTTPPSATETPADPTPDPSPTDPIDQTSTPTPGGTSPTPPDFTDTDSAWSKIIMIVEADGDYGTIKSHGLIASKDRNKMFLVPRYSQVSFEIQPTSSDKYRLTAFYQDGVEVYRYSDDNPKYPRHSLCAEKPLHTVVARFEKPSAYTVKMATSEGGTLGCAYGGTYHYAKEKTTRENPVAFEMSEGSNAKIEIQKLKNFQFDYVRIYRGNYTINNKPNNNYIDYYLDDKFIDDKSIPSIERVDENTIQITNIHENLSIDVKYKMGYMLTLEYNVEGGVVECGNQGNIYDKPGQYILEKDSLLSVDITAKINKGYFIREVRANNLLYQHNTAENPEIQMSLRDILDNKSSTLLVKEPITIRVFFDKLENRNEYRVDLESHAGGCIDVDVKRPEINNWTNYKATGEEIESFKVPHNTEMKGYVQAEEGYYIDTIYQEGTEYYRHDIGHDKKDSYKYLTTLDLNSNPYQWMHMTSPYLNYNHSFIISDRYIEASFKKVPKYTLTLLFNMEIGNVACNVNWKDIDTLYSIPGEWLIKDLSNITCSANAETGYFIRRVIVNGQITYFHNPYEEIKTTLNTKDILGKDILVTEDNVTIEVLFDDIVNADKCRIDLIGHDGGVVQVYGVSVEKEGQRAHFYVTPKETILTGCAEASEGFCLKSVLNYPLINFTYNVESDSLSEIVKWQDLFVAKKNNSLGYAEQSLNPFTITQDHLIEATFFDTREYSEVQFISGLGGTIDTTYQGEEKKADEGRSISFLVKKGTTLNVSIKRTNHLYTLQHIRNNDKYTDATVPGFNQDINLITLSKMKEDKYIIGAKYSIDREKLLQQMAKIPDNTTDASSDIDLYNLTQLLTHLTQPQDGDGDPFDLNNIFTWDPWSDDDFDINDYKQKMEEASWGDPVKISSGALVNEHEIDLSYKNTGIPVGIERIYNQNSLIDGSFGKNRIFNYDTKIVRGIDIENVRRLSRQRVQVENILLELKKAKDSLLDKVKSFYMGWRKSTYEKYQEVLDNHSKIKKSYDMASDAFYHLPEDIRNKVLYEDPQESGGVDDAVDNTTDQGQSSSGESLVKLGDVNGDGNVNLEDAMMIIQSCIGYNPPEFNRIAADVNRDDKVNIIDAVITAKVFLGLEELEDEYVSTDDDDETEINIGSESWFEYVSNHFPLELAEIKNKRAGYDTDNPSNNADVDITVEEPGINNEGEILESESETITAIIENYKYYKNAFEKIDKYLLELNNAIDMYDETWYGGMSDLCQDGIAVNVKISDFKALKDTLESGDLNDIEVLMRSNMLLNTFVDDVPLEMQDIGVNKVLLITESGAPHEYTIEAEPDTTSMNLFEFEGEELNIRNCYSSYDIIELKSSVPTKEKLYMLNGLEGGYLRVLEDKTKYYYNLFGQLNRIVDLNDNQVDFEYGYGLKNAANDTPSPEVGDVYITEGNVVVGYGDNFQYHVKANTKDYILESYDLEISFDPSVIKVDTSIGDNGIQMYNDNINKRSISVDNSKGKILIAGFYTTNIESSEALSLLTINWEAVGNGASYVFIKVKSLLDGSYSSIGAAQGLEGRVLVKNETDVDISEKTRRLTAVRDQYGREIVIDRDGVTGLINTITDPKGRTVSYTYNDDRRMTDCTDVDGDTVSYTYEGDLLKTTVKPDMSYVEYFYRDLNGRQVVGSVCDENGNTEYFNYYPAQGKYKDDIAGYSEHINQSGVMERNYYDYRLRILRTEYADESHKDYEYDENNNLVKYTDENGNVVEYGYDERNNKVEAKYANEDEDAAEEFSYEKWEYNDSGMVSKYTDRMNNETVYEYDGKGNLTGVVYPDLTREDYIRNARGQIEYCIDQKRNKTQYVYNDYGYVERIINAKGVKKIEEGDANGAEGSSVYFEYDEIGNLILEKNENGVETSYETEDMGDTVEKRKIEQFYRVSTEVYNNRKDMIKSINVFGEEAVYEYDKKHNITKIIYPTGDTEEYKYRDDGKVEEKIIGGISRTKYNYDNRGRLEKEEQVETGIRSEYRYTPGGRVNKVMSNGNKVYEYEYTPGGNIKWSSGPEDDCLLRDYYRYNSNGKLRSVTDRRGNETAYEYDNMERLVKIVNAEGIETEMEYDKNGNTTAVIENSNIAGYEARTETEYDELDRVIGVTDPMGEKESTVYNNIGLPEYVTEKDGKRYRYMYDFLGRLRETRKIMSDNTEVMLSSSRFFDMGLNKSRGVQIRYMGGYEKNLMYDALGRLKWVSDELRHATTYEYNRLGKLSKVINAKGYESTYEYDEAGRLVKETNANGESVEYRYDTENNTIRTIDAAGSVYQNRYDEYGRVIEKDIIVNDGEGFENSIIDGSRYRYDEVGNLIEEIDPDDNIYKYKYDKLNRLIEETDRSGETKRYEYYPTVGLTPDKARVIDFNGNETVTTYDKLGRTVEINQGDDLKSFEYNADGSIKRAVNKDSDLNFEYDEFGAQIKTCDAVKGTIVEHEYDRIKKKMKRRMIVNNEPEREVEYQFDWANRLTKVTNNLNTGGYSSTVLKQETTFSYDEINRLEKETRPDGIDVYYTYDKVGRVTMIKDINRYSNEVLRGFVYVYDKSGRVKYRVDETGGVVGYKYDEAGRIKEAMYPFAEKLNSYTTTHPKALRDFKDRLDAGYYILENIKSSSDNIHFYTSDIGITDPNFNDLDESSIEDLIGSNRLFKARVNGLLEINKEEDAIEFGGTFHATRGFEALFKIKLSELTDHKLEFENDQKVWREIYKYDKRGNITEKINGWGKIVNTYDINDRLKKRGFRKYEYDKNGNMITETIESDRATSMHNGIPFKVDYTYDNDNKLINLFDLEGIIGEYENNNTMTGCKIDYKYDAFGRRIYEGVFNSSYLNNTENDRRLRVPMSYVYDGFDIEHVGELGSTGELVSETIRAGGRPLCNTKYRTEANVDMRVLDTIKYYYQDNQGSTVMITDSSQSNISPKYNYDAFGRDYGTHENLLSTASLYNFTNRGREYGYTGKLYSSATGLYNYGYRDYSPQTGRFTTVDPIKDGGNWYAYCGNDPVNKIDPDGLEETANKNAMFKFMNGAGAPWDAEGMIKNSTDLLIITPGKSIVFYNIFKNGKFNLGSWVKGDESGLKGAIKANGISAAQKIIYLYGQTYLPGNEIVVPISDLLSIPSSVLKGVGTVENNVEKFTNFGKIIREGELPAAVVKKFGEDEAKLAAIGKEIKFKAAAGILFTAIDVFQNGTQAVTRGKKLIDTWDEKSSTQKLQATGGVVESAGWCLSNGTVMLAFFIGTTPVGTGVAVGFAIIAVGGRVMSLSAKYLGRLMFPDDVRNDMYRDIQKKEILYDIFADPDYLYFRQKLEKNGIIKSRDKKDPKKNKEADDEFEKMYKYWLLASDPLWKKNK